METKDENPKESMGVLWLILFIAVLYFIWVVLIKLGLTGELAEPYEYFGESQWEYIGAVIFIIFIVILLASIPSKEPVPSAPVQLKDTLEGISEDVKEPVEITGEEAVIKPKIITWPKEVSGGVYGDTLIKIDYNTTLKLRTFIARACLLCEKHNICWNEFKDKMTKEEFNAKVDCERTD